MPSALKLMHVSVAVAVAVAVAVLQSTRSSIP
jgi:hypothetical protein